MTDNNNECCICYENLNNGPTTRLVCNHTFCLKCIIMYYEETRNNCPLCRQNIFSENNNRQLTYHLSQRNNIRYNNLIETNIQDNNLIETNISDNDIIRNLYYEFNNEMENNIQLPQPLSNISLSNYTNNTNQQYDEWENINDLRLLFDDMLNNVNINNNENIHFPLNNISINNN